MTSEQINAKSRNLSKHVKNFEIVNWWIRNSVLKISRNLLTLQPGFTGVCVVQTYQLELPETENPTYIQIMMSVPYNLNSYNAYLAVGVDSMYLNSTGLFDQLYYYTGPFERALAGNLVEFTPDGGKGKQK